MKPTFQLVRRGTQFYAHNRITNQRKSLHTPDRQQGKELIAAKNDAERVPTMNLALGRMFFAARDAEHPERTWGAVMEALVHHGRDSTRLRYAMANLGHSSTAVSATTPARSWWSFPRWKATRKPPQEHHSPW